MISEFTYLGHHFECKKLEVPNSYIKYDIMFIDCINCGYKNMLSISKIEESKKLIKTTCAERIMENILK